MERSDRLPQLLIRTRQLHSYRLLLNSLLLLLVIVLAALVFRWVFPYFFTVLLWLWTAEALLLVALAVVWCLGAWAFASGRIRCPACHAPFVAKFHLWVPKACQACGYDITVPAK
jgi:hypothetical protein